MVTESSRDSRAERRAFLRQHTPTSLAAPWIALVGPNRWATTILNISVAGLALASPQSYPTGFEMRLEFRAQTSRTWHEKRVRVAHCTLQSEHLWIIGALFVEPFSEVEFQALLPKSCG
jgi:hypothetical protein